MKRPAGLHPVIKRYLAPGLSLLLAALLLALGLLNGQYQTVLRKAVMVCLECIGIG